MLLQGYLLVSLRDGMLLHSKAYAAHFGLVPGAGSARDCMNLASFLYAVYMSAQAIAASPAAIDSQPLKLYEMDSIRLQFHAAANEILCVVFSSVQLLPVLSAALAEQTCTAFIRHVNDNNEQQQKQQAQGYSSKRLKHSLSTVYATLAAAEGKECYKLLQCRHITALRLADIHTHLLIEPASPRLAVVRPAEPATASQQQQHAINGLEGWWWRRRAVRHAAATTQQQPAATALAAAAVASVCVCADAAADSDDLAQLLQLPLLQSISKQFPQPSNSAEHSCCCSVDNSVRIDTVQPEQVLWACNVTGIIVLYQTESASSVDTALQQQHHELSLEQAKAVTAFAQASEISLSHPIASAAHSSSSSSSSGGAKQL
jgi:hypothetical protein